MKPNQVHNVTVAQAIYGLKSLDERIRAAMAGLLRQAVKSGGLDLSPATAHRVTELLEPGAMLSSIAADEIATLLTPPIEPSAAQRALAFERTPSELLDLIARAGDDGARRELVGTFMMAVGSRCQGTRIGSHSPEAESLIALGDRLAAGSADAIEECRSWLVQNPIAAD